MDGWMVGGQMDECMESTVIERQMWDSAIVKPTEGWERPVLMNL